MATTVISTDTITSGVAHTVAAAFDRLFLLPGVNLVSETNDAINGSASDAGLILQGNIVAFSDGIDYGSAASSTANLSVTLSGSIVAGGFGIDYIGDRLRVEISSTGSITAGNWGIITSNNGAEDFTSYILNEGSITGDVGIIATTNGYIINHGTITGLDASFITGEGYGIALIAAGRTGTLTIINTGVISGVLGAIGSGILYEFGNTVEIVRNSGELQGNVDLYGLDDVLLNTGLIVGDVDMGTGNDLFDTRFGTLAGQADGGAGDDLMLGSSFDDVFFGGEDNDDLRGGDGDDYLDGGIGMDSIKGGDGDDELFGGDDNDELFGRNGDDTLSGGDGIDELFGNDGDDVLDGGAGNDILNGGRGDDNMAGGDGVDRLFGRDGNDNMGGGSGNDFFDGGNGDDRFVGGGGNDRIEGGDGIDTAAYTGTQADYTIQVLSNGAVRVTDIRSGSPEGVDVLTNVEFLNFTDAIVDVAGL